MIRALNGCDVAMNTVIIFLQNVLGFDSSASRPARTQLGDWGYIGEGGNHGVDRRNYL
jgi:hypothetical protein